MEVRSWLELHRITAKVSGNNTSRGYVNINCPLCNDDPSYHMRIAEDWSHWYCLRGQGHKGRSLKFLMYWVARRTGLVAEELIADLPKGLNQETSGPRPQREVRNSVFAEFLPADQSQEMLDYLERRLFMFPEETAERFNLKYAVNGKWAGRLIIPLTIGWTGRSVRDHIEPRYESETNDSGFFLYGKGETALLVEGPVDAMKIASVSMQFMVLGMTGSRISPALLREVKTRGIKRLILIPDSEVSAAQRVNLTQELRNNLPQVIITRAILPENPATLEPFKDCGEMSEGDARRLLYTL